MTTHYHTIPSSVWYALYDHFNPLPPGESPMSTDTTNQGGFTVVRSNPDNAMSVRLPPLNDLVKPQYLGPKVIGTLDLSTDDGVERYLRSAGTVDIDRETASAGWFPVSHWVAEYKENIAGEGEPPREGVRVTLFAPDGQTFAFAGAVPHDSFRKIRAIYGDGPWEPALQFTTEEITTASKRSSYILIARRRAPV